MSLFEHSFNFLQNGKITILLLLVSAYFYIPKLSGRFQPVITNEFIPSHEWLQEGQSTRILRASFGFNKVRDCPRSGPSLWYAIDSDGTAHSLTRGTRNLSEGEDGVGPRLRGPWDFYGAPEDTVAIEVKLRHNCFGWMFPEVTGTALFPLYQAGYSADMDRLGISWERN